MRTNRYVLQDISMGGYGGGGGISGRQEEIDRLKRLLIIKTDENTELVKKCSKLEQSLNKITNKEKVYI